MSKSNKKKGDDFRDFAKPILEEALKTKLRPEQKISIGNPEKEHAFDLVNPDNSIVIECKNYSWTKSNRKPSAKISTLNEALLYFSFLGRDIRKILCINNNESSEKPETLAEYYVRNYGFLLRDVIVYEISEKEGNIRRIDKE